MSAVEELKSAAGNLSAADRAALANFLLSTLAPEPSGTDAEWRATIARRVADIRAGVAPGRPVEDVLAELRDEYP